MHPALVAYAVRCATNPLPAGTVGVVPVVGLPGVQAVELRGWATPSGAGVEVRGLVRPGGQRARLRHPVRVLARSGARGDELRPPEGGAVLRTAHADWYTYDVAPTGTLEVERIDADGREVMREVPPDHTYVMTCSCGRLRFAPRRALAKISSCRVCTHEARCSRRALAQRAAYEPAAARATREQLRAHARALRAVNTPLREIARACGKSVSWASRVLRSSS